VGKGVVSTFFEFDQTIVGDHRAWTFVGKDRKLKLHHGGKGKCTGNNKEKVWVVLINPFDFPFL